MKATRNIPPPQPPPPVTVTIEMTAEEAGVLLAISRTNVSIPDLYENKNRASVRNLLDNMRGALQSAGVRDSF